MKTAFKVFALILVFVLSLVTGFSIPRSNAQVPAIHEESLPSGAITTGMVYSGTAGLAYAVSYAYGQIYAITIPPNVLTPMSYVTYQFGTVGNYNRLYYGLAVDSAGNLWVTRRDQGNDGTPAGLSKITLESTNATSRENFVINNSNYEWDSVGFCNNFIFAGAGSTLFKVNPSTNAVTNITLGASGAYYGMNCDSSGNLWFSDILNGFLYSYSPNGTLDQYSGFTRPLGVAISGSTVYVAENNATSPAIAEFNTNTHAITTASVKTGAVPYDVAAISGSIVYSVSQNLTGSSTGIGVLGGVYYGVNEAATYDLTGDSGGNILSSYYGSAGVLRLSDWQPVELVTSTTIIHSTSTVFSDSTEYTTVTQETNLTLTNTITVTNILVVQPEINLTSTTVTSTILSTITVESTNTVSTNTTVTVSSTSTNTACTLGVNC